ncbi:MAG: DNA gyrase subunit A [Bdellovibrionales bacterium RIFOXYC1_FULL_54_43]|nr:MAG: DNA gyrase subunit A [Bdellovibrionales bacterium RIFOXYC1_FULL_54_43]OFZ83903.1 MAG: DNA gyrase subunit A [Bdellovibrionales bacterium RIFOXYD1_FULL_55_31]
MTEELNTEKIDKSSVVVTIEDEMRGAYLDYAMSVIVGRALPDVRDGLKPVHRRALYAMYDLGNTHNKAYKKSARVVGDVIGKYHPHGDSAVYDTIVRMAQDFSLRYPLVDGQGNFGSIDGDSAAAMRYTEIRMARITDELLADLDKETVDFGPNYDESLQEPLVLPSKIPNLLINGSTGIAVGMATNIPPHNLCEIVDATCALIDKPSLDSNAMLEYVKGPDFPTGAYVFGGAGIRDAYRTGRGAITLRAKAEIETYKGDRERIIVTELPYQVNKAKLIEKIADLVREKRIEGISDLRDESDRSGMRVVIEIRRGENSNVILNQLYKMTQLQESYGINLLAIHQGQPKTFNLRDMLWAFVEHRKDVVIRRTIYDLKKAEARAHILEGLKRAVENIDAVIALIKAAKNPDEAKAGLTSKFQFSEIQAQAILEMRLQRLTGLERDKIIEEYKQVLSLIEELKHILSSESLVYDIIKKELLDIRKTYGDERRTEIVVGATTEFEVEDLIADEDALVSITRSGYVKRTDPSQFRSQHRGGRGIRGVTTGDEDFVTAIYRTNTLSYLLCFTDKGRLYWLKVYKVPEAARAGKGKAIVNLIALAPGEAIKAILPVREFKENEYVVMVTRRGVIKKTALSEFSNVRNAGIVAISTDEGDELVSAKLTQGNNDVFVCSKDGMSIRFNEEDVRPMGRTARGVIGISLDEGDRVVAMEVLDTRAGFEVLTITESGYGKRTPVADYRAQSRGGKGIITMKTNDRNGAVMGSRQVLPKDDVMLVSNKGQMIRIHVGEISEQGRNTQGVRLMTMSPGEKVVSFEYMAETAVENGDIEEVGVASSPGDARLSVPADLQPVAGEPSGEGNAAN